MVALVSTLVSFFAQSVPLVSAVLGLLPPAAAAGAAESILVGTVIVIALGVGAQWLAWRFGLPSILLLLLFGFVAGPVTGLIDPASLQGDWVFAFVSLSIGIILFEGGLTLRLSELREVGRAVFNLITVGVAVTWALAGTASYFVLGLDLGLAVLVGAILTVTGPTVVSPLLRHVRPTGRVGTVAKWEGITIDPVGAILAVLVLETLVYVNDSADGLTSSAALQAAEGLLMVVVIGVGVSALGAALLILLLRRRLVPDYLQNALALMVVVVAFAVSDVLHAESGLLTTTLMGIFVANQSFVPVRRLEEFKEDLQVLLIASLFIVLSARLELSALDYIDGPALLFLAGLILVVRPLAVWVSSWGTGLSWSEWGFLSWLAPRGIVAAAVASLFAIRLEGLYPADQVGLIVPVVFLVIVGTVAVYGLTIAPLARWLGLAQPPDPQGVLFLGAQPWVRALARALGDLGFTTLLIDTNPQNVRDAREEGMRAERANALTEHVAEDLDLGGIGRLFAVTPNDEINSLAVLHFSEVFESADVYQIPTRSDVQRDREGDLPRHLRGYVLFRSGVTYASLARRFETGDQLRIFDLSEALTYEDLKSFYDEHESIDEASAAGGERASENGQGQEAARPMVPLVLKREDSLRIFSQDVELKAQAGDQLLALVPPVQDETSAPWTKKAEALRQSAGDSDAETFSTFETLIERAPVIDLDEPVSYREIVEQATERLAEGTALSVAELTERFMSEARHQQTLIARGAALPHYRSEAVTETRIVLVRCPTGLCIEFGEEQGGEDLSDPVYAVFFLVSPGHRPEQHLRTLAHIASRVDEDTFMEEWRAAGDAYGVREALLQRTRLPRLAETAPLNLPADGEPATEEASPTEAAQSDGEVRSDGEA